MSELLGLRVCYSGVQTPLRQLVRLEVGDREGSATLHLFDLAMRSLIKAAVEKAGWKVLVSSDGSCLRVWKRVV